MSKEKYFVHIKPKSSLMSVNLKEIVEYKDLIFLFVRRNLKLRYAQTILGPLWLILTPFMTSIVYSFVFGSFMGAYTDGVPHFLFYLSGTTMWALFSEITNKCSNTFIENSRIFSKIYFPRMTAPISQSITGVINFGIQFMMFFIVWLVYLFMGENLHFSFNMLLIPILILHTAVLAASVGIIVASLTVKYKDLIYVITFGMQLWMFLTPVVYPISTVGEGLGYILLSINPVTSIINNFKYAMLGTGELLVSSWVLSAFITLICMFVGVLSFNKTEKTFTDII